MVAVDSEKEDLSTSPFIHLLFLHNYHSSNAYALNLNRSILEDRNAFTDPIPSHEGQLQAKAKYTHVVKDWNEAALIIAEWFIELGIEKRAVAAGKNVSAFDLQFFPEDVKGLFIHRALDPGSMYATHGDLVPPDTAECCRRAGISDTVTHNAYDDAIQVAYLINKKLGGKK